MVVPLRVTESPLVDTTPEVLAWSPPTSSEFSSMKSQPSVTMASVGTATKLSAMLMPVPVQSSTRIPVVAITVEPGLIEMSLPLMTGPETPLCADV